MIEYLTLEDVLALVGDLGVGPVRDIGLLDSAVHRPRVVVFGRDAYPAVGTKAAALLESLVKNRALIDGNKRLGWLATVVFFGLNEITLEAPDDDGYDLVNALASGTMDHPEAASRLALWRGPIAETVTRRRTTRTSTEDNPADWPWAGLESDPSPALLGCPVVRVGDLTCHPHLVPAADRQLGEHPGLDQVKDRLTSRLTAHL